LIARAGIVSGALLIAAVILPSSLAAWLRADHPETAAQIAPWDSRAAAGAAAALRTDPRSPDVRQLVSKALARDLTVTAAIELRAADFAASGRPAEAAELFRLSDRLSRRSLPTRLWLIQDAVDRGDVTGALHNFDIALRTSTDAPLILYPVLSKASADPGLTIPLARTLDRASDWRLMFLEWTLATNSNLDSIAKVVARMRDRAFVTGNSVDQHFIERLVTARQFEPALLLHRAFGRNDGLIADTNFADVSSRYPFGWGLVSGASLGADRVQGPMLTYHAAVAQSGQVAAQLLGLAPGRYILATRSAAAVKGEVPYWSITCGEAGGAKLATIGQPAAAGAEARATFRVPDGCLAQWLTLSIRPGSDEPESGAIAWVALEPI
jgi:hypothetical protein